VTLSGTGFTLSIFVYQGISKKNEKYKIVQTLANIG
jgi:cellobiose-specific phosphotransferase system component IIC